MRETDWIGQAKRTIGSAENARSAGYHEDAAFLAHHAAYLSVVGLLMGSSGVPDTGQSLYYTMKDIEGVTTELLHRARLLDAYHLPSRYPYCFETGCPADYFDENMSEEAIDCAKAILEFTERQMG